MQSAKILLISYHFPPGGGVHVHRALSLAKYLPQNGLEVHVLTTRNPAVPHYDPAMLAEVPAEVQIHREWTLEPSFQLRKKLWAGLTSECNSGSEPEMAKKTFLGAIGSRASRKLTRLLSPDPQVLWRPFAFRSAVRLIEREGIDTVWVTAPPFSSFLIGNALKVRYPGIHLISDFRDEWLCYYVNEFAFKGNDYIRAQAAEIERLTVELSDRVVAVTPVTRDVMRSRYPAEPAAKFSLIPNGYDGAAFASSRPRHHGADKIVISYVGTLYNQCSPATYLDALDRLPSEIRSRFETRFIGRIAQEFEQGILENRKTSIKVMGFVPHERALDQMAESDYLLLTWKDWLNVPGKLYEYLATNKPILGLVRPQSDVARILRESGVAWVADWADGDGIEQILHRASSLDGSDPISAGLMRPNHEFVRRFERSRLAKDYADLIRGCGAPLSESRIVGIKD